MNIRLTITTIGIYFTLAMVIFFTVKWSRIAPKKVAVYPREITINDQLHYSDSTPGVASRLWEFGNGDKSNSRKGTYKFRKEGKYLMRLTVNNKLLDTFFITVKKPAYVYVKDTSITIFANATGIAGQNVHFKVLGAGVDWCEWYFGESGKIDARDLETFHAFSNVGTYDVKLITNLNQRTPIVHTIKILPPYKVVDSFVPTEKADGGGGGGGSDLKQHIQTIASGGNFNMNYNYIVRKYLCGNAHTKVVTNTKNTTDFYSYCQNLQVNTGITIDQVNTELDAKTNCISKLIITQH